MRAFAHNLVRGCGHGQVLKQLLDDSQDPETLVDACWATSHLAEGQTERVQVRALSRTPPNNCVLPVQGALRTTVSVHPCVYAGAC